jgi:putative ABC transport system substrate-binding protein
MRRREFIGLVGGIAIAWPLAVRAQKGERIRRIGVLWATSEDDPVAQARQAAFLQGLQQLGWIDGQNVRIDVRWAAGNLAKARQYAADLIALAPDVILASGGAIMAPLLQATRTVPIVSRSPPIPSAPAMSTDYRDRAAMRPALCCSNTVCAENGWRFSRR